MLWGVHQQKTRLSQFYGPSELVEMSNIKNLDKDIEESLKLGISFLHGIDKLYK